MQDMLSAFFFKDAFPINVLNQIKSCPEVCRIFCATANPLEVIVASSAQGNGVLGVMMFSLPRGLRRLRTKPLEKNF